ncbi:beta-N-acetylhexosaminidase [Algoriphagus sp. H41]|uniref:beta-N-acetylhexosaminidase n=1 Tax=Algoriphagus oliviformis TaxID=2811231 RepID=A0ABS3CAG7_9BACT|nr:beta-N-acetylhexosaminidase [Algoriphagus oliviformis]MBN7813151.1 beta-N-acetylhexosaminidase [Algoriphagus oliviformis]
MKKTIWTLLLAGTLAMGGCKETPSFSDSAIIPLPQELANGSGSFDLSPEMGIQLVGSGEKLTKIGNYLASKLRPATGFDLPVSNESGEIVLELTGIGSSEAYEIEVTGDEVKISADGEAGLFYGVQTLLQLLPQEIAHSAVQSVQWTIPGGSIKDEPSFSYRGSMLDVARHFISLEDVKYYIDQMAAYKLNYLHLHLTDDQGWRIEIKSWPRLTEVGGSTEVGGGEGGFYTQEEYKEIVAYAAERFITVVPEVDMPGHTNAVLASYGDLNPGINLPDGDLTTVTKTPEREVQVNVRQASELYTGIEVGWSTFDSDLELTYAFVDSVVREISEITPGPYFHIGGDESHVTEKDDYIYFVERVQDIVSKYGKTSIGWDEVATAKLLPGNIAQYWSREDENAKLAKAQGNQILMSPNTRVYLDMQYDSTSRIGLHWAGYVDLDAAYSWEPTELIEGFTAADILGVEAPLWTETVTNRADIDYLAFPRLSAIAEVAWTKKERRSWDSYAKRVPVHGKRWDIQGVGFYRSPKVTW